MGLPAEDILAIHSLYERYNRAIDHSADPEDYVRCWTAEGTFRRASGAILSGETALREFATEYRASNPGVRHWISNVIVEGDGDEARGSCYLMVLTTDTPPAFLLTGIYTDHLRKDQGEWRFASRHSERDGT